MSDMEHDPIRSLIRRLTVATKQGQVQWEEIEPHVFGYARPASAVTVGSSDRDGHHPFFVEVLNRRRETVEAITTLNVSPVVRDEIVDLYDAIRREARGFRDTLGDLLQGLPPDPGSSGDLPL